MTVVNLRKRKHINKTGGQVFFCADDAFVKCRASVHPLARLALAASGGGVGLSPQTESFFGSFFSKKERQAASVKCENFFRR